MQNTHLSLARDNTITWTQFKMSLETAISASPLVKSFLAGSFSGTCSTVLFQPLDLVKTRLQSAVAVQGNKPSGVVATVFQVVRNERIIGLWKGITPSITRCVPGVGVYFCSMHWLKTNLGSADPPPWESILIGAGARTVAGVTMLPITVVKTRFESGQFKYNGVLPALYNIYKLEGARGLYSGLSATLLRDVPFSGLYLMFYTQLKKAVPSTGTVDPTAPWVHFSCGIVAGSFASVVTQPADVIKTHMQLFPERFSHVGKVIMFIFQENGTKGFFRGIVPRTMRRTLMAALAWTVYEQVMKSTGLK
ncbi:unnamed protein product [Owenia fusiformis]|uniref:Mitochondrial glycine transporter n=1 Tax=Owenia fusiformis TaxID=6347 RepID=A0A8J1U6V0_OWEFU|nr:unnamed protein product [Owenia fusiformis]